MKRKPYEYNRRINVVYRDEQVAQLPVGYSKSPNKPKILLEYLKSEGHFKRHFQMDSNWDGFKLEDFYEAHTKEYVHGFFMGKEPHASSNGLSWNYQFADSVRYTNASLYNAIKNSIINPSQVQFSPVSGFHHAHPRGGGGFCTFSGQVIASRKLYKEYGVRGAYIDLDGHFGNSIPDSRKFAKTDSYILHNINPRGQHEEYINDLKDKLQDLRQDLILGKVDYVVFAHGADSHMWDDLGHQCSTMEWLECSKLVYRMINEVSMWTGRTIPLTLALFGGYRADDYQSVISLHAMDLMVCSSLLCDSRLEDYILKYYNRVRPSQKKGGITLE